jgi:hypothetical protein
MIDGGGGIALTPAALLAEAASVLSAASYRVDRDAEELLDLPSERAFVAEDKYGIVVVVVYDTWSDLARRWRSAQARSVDVLSDRFTRLDRKAWDGYLILLTPALAAEADATVHEIRYDTSRIRKFVGTGEDIHSLNDVERILLPLLPLAQETVEVEEDSSPLDELPERLERSGVARDLVKSAVDAFKAHRPIVQEISRHLSSE